MPQTRHGRDRPHRSACRASRRLQGPPGLDRGRCRRPEAPALGRSPELWVTCALGPYNFEFMTEVTQRDRVACTRSTAIFINRWDGSRHVLLRALPGATSAPPPVWTCRAPPIRRTRRGEPIYEWRQERLFELWRLWDAEIRKVNPDARFIPNTGGGAQRSRHEAHRRKGADPVRRPAGPQRTDAVGRTARTAKSIRATMGRKPIGGIFSVASRSPTAGRTRSRATPRSACG